MVKRTRRNLSDPTIKRIIKAQATADDGHRNEVPPPGSGGGSGRTLGTVVVSLLLLAAAVLVAINWTDISRTFQSLLAAEPPPAYGNAVTPEEETVPPKPMDATTDVDNGGAPSDAGDAPAMARRIQVEILNGCGVNGLAERLTTYLRTRNIDVVSRGNYVTFDVRRTQILDRIDNPERARELADIMGVANAQVKLVVDRNLQLDATIILGKDYASLKAFSD